VPGGNPNGSSCPGVASLPAGGADAGAGNPINVMTGNKYQREDDMPALPGVLGIEIVRHYNSAYSGPGQPNGVLGRGWRLSYETELVDRFGKIQILQADGGRVIFDRDRNAPTGCRTNNPENGTMTLGLQNGQPNYTWTWTDGRKMHFTSSGKLDRITAATGEVVRLLYDSQDVLVRVIDPQGRSLNMAYFDRRTPNQFHGVQFIDTPVGRFAYEYGSTLPKGAGLLDKRQLLANLVRVRLPDRFDPYKKAHALSSRGTTGSTISRVYHHEDPRSPWLMTGISIETIVANDKPITTRYSTYGYDDTGRAILSTHAGNVDKVMLDNHEAGKTVLTNSLGAKTVYRYTVIAGEYRLLEVRGAGCALCGEPNIRYRYNRVGQLVESTSLADNGDPATTTRTERDKLGRVIQLTRIAYRNGKPGPVQLQARFEYRGAGFAPTLVARPSVIPGMELVTRIDYNEAGQPLRVTESGWSPTFDGKQPAARIERTTRYRYTTINGRSQLAEIDGPLPNGKTNSPADSDVTVLEYDRSASSPEATGGALAGYERHQGLLTRVIAPGNLITEVLERDAALRPTRLRTTDGGLVQETSVSSDWRGAPGHLELAAGALRWKLEYEYNPLGQLVAVTMPGNLRISFAYDGAGRRTLTVLPDGSGVRSELNTEDRTVRTTRLLDALAAGGASLADLRFAYDHAAGRPDRLAEVGDAAGPVKRYSYDELGRVSLVRSALGIATAFAYDAAGLLAARTDAAVSADAASISLAYDPVGHATGITAGNGVKTLRRYDDFGRKVIEADPDRGITIFRHDAAGHVVARIDEAMIATRFAYDHAGRLLTMGADDKPDLVQYRYRGRQLIGMISTPDGNVAHATERTNYERDAFGRVTKETRWLANVAPSAGAAVGFNFVTTSEYDQAGRLAGQTLPDGHRLQYRYTPADVGKAGARRPGQLEAILFDDSVVISNIEQTIAGGITGYTMGNGARQQVSLDSRGGIEQLQVLAGTARPEGWWGRITAWFSGSKGNGDTLFYRQVNRYDADGRITRIDRQMPSTDLARGQISRGDTYAYDQMNRLTGIVSSDGTSTRYAYDKGGNRLLETVGTNRGDGLHSPSAVGAPSQTVNRYAYASGTNRLNAITSGQPDIDKVAITEPRNATEAAQFVRDAWFYHATGVPLAQLIWTDRGNRPDRRIVYNSAKRPIATYVNEQLLARYHYNTQGERIAKTVYSPRPPLTTVSYQQGYDQGATSYSLYRDQRLAAETDSAGRLTAHYVYLYGKPVAKIEMRPNESWLHKLLESVTPRSEPDSSDTEGRIYTIVTDHLGTPQLVFGKGNQIVWQAETRAFGQAHVSFAAVRGENDRPFVMNLRLAGQVFDPETKLHYNYLRDYDPQLGRYTTPDPIGVGGGFNPYSYVSNSPLINIDPLGLYQSDVHYYMTFFLAVAAGFSYDDARTIAQADQYIDDNPLTRPIDVDVTGSPSYINTVLNNAQRLKYYHFTLSDDNGRTIPYYRDAGLSAALYYPSKQLQNLRVAAEKAPNRCAELQFFGEYLHAFADTFSHRNDSNTPVDAVWNAGVKELGIGHGTLGTNPDMTYNHWSTSYGVIPTHWNTNEDRTLEMEREVFAELISLKGGLNKPNRGADPRDASFYRRFSTIEPFLREFNSTQANEDTKDAATSHDPNRPNFASKVLKLQSALEQLGFKDINLTPRRGVYSYNENIAQTARAKNLDGLKPEDYPGTCIKSCAKQN
jgi:RHS repeat-associated protein